MSLVQELEQHIAALGRPPLVLGGFKAIAASLARAKAWDAEHPEQAAEYRRLCDELDRETKRIERAEAERLALERALRTSAVKLERSGVGERSLTAAAQAEDTEALGVVKRFLAAKDRHWLALCGTKGVGKSVAATWAVREVIRSGGSAAFRRTAEIAKLSGFEAGAAEMEHLKSVQLLALDDFGTELLTDYARAQLFELLDARHEAYGRTILTSNLQWAGAGGMAERLGERLVDRIAHSGTRQQLAASKSMRRSS